MNIASLKNQYKNQPLWWWVATWFGAGLSPKVSGTVGSFAALPVGFVIHCYLGNVALMIAAFIAFGVGWWASEKFIQLSNKGTDPKEVVIDEVAGQWLLLSVLFPTWQSYLVGFVLFRIFDIVKPWPVCWADEKVKGGLGVMLDDMLAGFYPVLVYSIIMIQAMLLDSADLLQPFLEFLGGHY